MIQMTHVYLSNSGMLIEKTEVNAHLIGGPAGNQQ